MNTKVYIAGPMRGYPLYNFPAFDAAEARLREAGYDPVNPAALDRAAGFDEHTTLTDDELKAMMPEFMKRDLVAICDCQAIAMLPGWVSSRGAVVELGLARLLGLTVLCAEALLPLDAILHQECVSCV